MKILFLLLLLVCASPAYGAFAVITNTCTGTTDGNDGVTPLVSSSIDTSGANFIVAYSSAYIGSFDIVLTDSKSNTWHGLTEIASSRLSRVWYAYAATVGAGHTFTLSGTNFYNPAFCVIALSGAATSDPFDVENTNSNSSSSTIATNSITPSVNNELVIAGLASAATSTAPSIGGGFTAISQTGDGHDLLGLAYLIQTTATAANPTWTIVDPANNQASIASFKVPISVTPVLRRPPMAFE